MKTFTTPTGRKRASRSPGRTALHIVNTAASLALMVVFSLLLAPLAVAGTAFAQIPAIGTTHQGTFVMDDAGNRIVPNVSAIIDEYDRELTPLTSFIDKFGGLNMDDQLRNPTSVEFETLERSPYPRFAQVNGGSAAGAAGGTVTVPVDAGHVIVPGHILKSFSNGTDTGIDYLVRASTQTSVTVVALPQVNATTRGTWRNAVAYGTVPAFADNEYLQWVGVAKSEADAASRPIAMEPLPTFQFIQTFDGVWALSDHAQRISVYGTGALKDEKTQMNVTEFKKTRELAYLFQGQLSVTEDVNLNAEIQKYWKMRGARGYTTGTITLPDNPTLSNVIEFIYDAHAGHDGATNKLLCAGEDVMSRFDTVTANADIVETVQDETTLGVMVKTLKGTKGSVDLLYHPLFDEIGLKDEGMLFDLDYMGRAVMQEVDERGGDGKQKEYGQMVDRDVWQLISKEALVMHRANGARSVHKRVVIA